MTIKGSTSQACAACKYQRRRCLPDCRLAPYFPADQPKMFQTAHRLFGVSNILKILKHVDASQRSEAMRSIIYESDMRHKHPVLGCYGVVHHSAYHVKVLEEQLHTLRLQIEFLKMQQQHNKEHNSSSHLVVHDHQDDTPSLLQLGMAPPNNVNNNHDLKGGFSCCNNDEQFWGVQQAAEYGGAVVLNNNSNVMDRFEMTGDQHQLQQYFFDIHSQQQQEEEEEEEMAHNFKGMHPFVDCGGQSSFIDSKVSFEASSGSDDQSSILRHLMDAMGHRSAESGVD